MDFKSLEISDEREGKVVSSRSKSFLFLFEQLMVILIFAISAVVCARIFVEAHIIAGQSADINNALIVAKSGAEAFRASSGDLGLAAELLGAENVNNVIFLFYDSSWARTDADNALYVLSITPAVIEEETLVSAQITVRRLGDGVLAGNVVSFNAVAANP
ncbi:MAG: hypothetical protein FWG65_12485 [Turicibacter sp.]|nr:hypothetical protein [Turicibacter sp.]